MIRDATSQAAQPLTEARLCAWPAVSLPTGCGAHQPEDGGNAVPNGLLCGTQIQATIATLETLTAS